MLAERTGAFQDVFEGRLDEDGGGVDALVCVVGGGEGQARAQGIARRGLGHDLDVDVPETAFVCDGGQVMRPVARAQDALRREESGWSRMLQTLSAVSVRASVARAVSRAARC